MLLQQIQQMDVGTARTAYYNALPMDEVLPDDISQHILNLSGSHNTKGINKRWKQLSEKSETLFTRNI